MTVEQYLREKIEREAQFYETRAARIDTRYLAEVERLTKRMRYKLLARFLRETMTPRYIASAVADIRELLKSGEIIEADYSLDILKKSIRFVEDRLKQRYFDAGAKVRAGGIAAAARRWGSPAARAKRADEMRKLFAVKRSQGSSIGEAEGAVAKFFGVTPKTVRTARNGK